MTTWVLEQLRDRQAASLAYFYVFWVSAVERAYEFTVIEPSARASRNDGHVTSTRYTAGGAVSARREEITSPGRSATGTRLPAARKAGSGCPSPCPLARAGPIGPPGPQNR
jgi:hypothetical protein